MCCPNIISIYSSRIRCLGSSPTTPPTARWPHSSRAWPRSTLPPILSSTAYSPPTSVRHCAICSAAERSPPTCRRGWRPPRTPRPTNRRLVVERPTEVVTIIRALKMTRVWGHCSATRPLSPSHRRTTITECGSWATNDRLPAPIWFEHWLRTCDSSHLVNEYYPSDLWVFDRRGVLSMIIVFRVDLASSLMSTSWTFSGTRNWQKSCQKVKSNL